MKERQLRKLVREEAAKMLSENRAIDDAKRDAEGLMKKLNQAQMSDGGMRAGEIAEAKRHLEEIMQILRRI